MREYTCVWLSLRVPLSWLWPPLLFTTIQQYQTVTHSDDCPPFIPLGRLSYSAYYTLSLSLVVSSTTTTIPTLFTTTTTNMNNNYTLGKSTTMPVLSVRRINDLDDDGCGV